MHTCYVCGKAEATVVDFRSHLQRHSVVGELTVPLKCCICKSSFSKTYNLIRHTVNYHMHGTEKSMGDAVLNTTLLLPCVSADAVAYDNHESCHSREQSVSNLLEDVRKEGTALVAGLRANSSIPYNVIPKVVDSFNQMSASLSLLFQTDMLNCLADAGLTKEVLVDVKAHLEHRVLNTSKPLDFLSSRYKQDKYFDNHPLAVCPESVSFGLEIASHSGCSKLVSESFQYVSVEKTLHSLLQNEDYVRVLLHDKCNSDIIQNYADGQCCKTDPLFSDSSKVSLQLQLFYDGLGVTNPLRGQSTLHNVSVFYFTIRNLPQLYNSCFANVHLLALCYSLDVKKYGFDPILERFVAEINRLSSLGMKGTYPIIGDCTVYAGLSQVTCDNLALNSIFGHIESFSCDFFCTICYASQTDIQKYYSEDHFQLRTIQSYNADITAQQKNGKKHHRGVKKPCKLNDIVGYHITNNWSLDIMHIVLEGIVPYELGCILYGLCDSVTSLDIEAINCEVQLFWGKMTVDKANKPLELNRVEEMGQGISPAMKAMQYGSLLKYLPLILGKFVPPSSSNVHWKLLLHLSHLVDLIFAPRFTHAMVTYLKSVISDHLHMFVDLYGSHSSVRLRPKHHLLVHLPSVILKCGPLVGMSCLRYELKNSFFKRSAHIVCNFTNICQTLAYRHQQRALYSLLSHEYVRDAPVVNATSMQCASALVFSKVFTTKFDIDPADDVCVASRLTVATITYKKGDFLAVGVNHESGDPVFGKVVSFVSPVTSDIWYVAVELLATVEFCAHVHSYSVCELKPAKHEILLLSDLIDYHPLYCHVAGFVNGTQVSYIRLPYHIFE